jgi:hypothetical protein
MSLNNSQRENNMAKWHDIDWTLTKSLTGELDLKPNVDNTLRFRRRTDDDGAVLYELSSQPPGPPPVLKDPWLTCVAVPQMGLPIQGFLDLGEDKIDHHDPDKVNELAERFRERYLVRFGHVFERLVGTLTNATGEHYSVTFYQVPNVCKDESKTLLMAHVRTVDASPGGVVSGNN